MKDLPLNNKDLLYGVAADARGSFERFYHLYYTQVFRFAYYFLKDKDASREVVTDVFFAIWKSRRKLKEIGNIETYLYIVVRHEAARHTTRQAETNTLPLDELPQSPDNCESESPEDKLLTQEIETLLAEAIGELPDKCRRIFLLARQEGMKPKEIAELLSLSESTVRVQMKIAIEKIVARLKPSFPNLSFSFLLMLIC